MTAVGGERVGALASDPLEEEVSIACEQWTVDGAVAGQGAATGEGFRGRRRS